MAGLQHALPAFWYLDQAAFRRERERERLLYREWFCAGRADQLQRPGSLQVVDVAGESVLLVRTRAGELRAHYNVCRHRGSQVVPCPPSPAAPIRLRRATSGRLITVPRKAISATTPAEYTSPSTNTLVLVPARSTVVEACAVVRAEP